MPCQHPTMPSQCRLTLVRIHHHLVPKQASKGILQRAAPESQQCPPSPVAKDQTGLVRTHHHLVPKQSSKRHCSAGTFEPHVFQLRTIGPMDRGRDAHVSAQVM